MEEKETLVRTTETLNASIAVMLENHKKEVDVLNERIKELTAQVAWLNRQLFGRKSESLDIIEHTLENALGMAAGIVCDGAKPSCAGKIALSVEAGILGYEMSKQGDNLLGGDGIIGKDVEETIDHIGCLGRLGMKETDVEILKIMVE